ncbi:AB hydrolase-1 domain-containing protein [Mycena venus]|uniref:AB hydrolase-1 domain-containing protein n=1 Tax=Mycena venus TaxID=2733690 RepID=A0A8H6YKL8_9AGAR|nr:AB hydrolase-1 domain-containing protein [Mycena venus]
MESVTQPTFVLVPGIFHTAIHAEILVDSLRAKGYSSEVIAHPTIGPLAATAPPNADAKNVRQVLEDLINEQQKDVVLFCHSYGGAPGCQSVNGLEKRARAKAGQKGGIVRIIFLSAILPREGETVLQTLAAAEIPPGEWLAADPATGIASATSKAAEVLFHDLQDDQADYWASKLEPMSANSVSTPATNVCWDVDVPKVAIFCKRDRVFPLEGQRRIVERVKSVNGGDWVTYEMDCGHSPFLSHVEELVEILTRFKMY